MGLLYTPCLALIPTSPLFDFGSQTHLSKIDTTIVNTMPTYVTYVP